MPILVTIIGVREREDCIQIEKKIAFVFGALKQNGAFSNIV